MIIYSVLGILKVLFFMYVIYAGVSTFGLSAAFVVAFVGDLSQGLPRYESPAAVWQLIGYCLFTALLAAAGVYLSVVQLHLLQ